MPYKQTKVAAKKTVKSAPKKSAPVKKLAIKKTVKPMDSFKKDSTNFANQTDSIISPMLRQLRSGNSSSIDSARTSAKNLEEKMKEMKKKYPNKKFY
jgi:hypothetical protein